MASTVLGWTLATVLAVASARAQEPPTVATKGRPASYTGSVLLTDLAILASGALGAAVLGEHEAGAAGAMLMVSGPTWHLAHGNHERAGISLALRIGLPLLGFLAGEGVDCGGDDCRAIAPVVGVSLGGLAALIVDWMVLSRHAPRRGDWMIRRSDVWAVGVAVTAGSEVLRFPWGDSVFLPGVGLAIRAGRRVTPQLTAELGWQHSAHERGIPVSSRQGSMTLDVVSLVARAGPARPGRFAPYLAGGVVAASIRSEGVTQGEDPTGSAVGPTLLAGFTYAGVAPVSLDARLQYSGLIAFGESTTAYQMLSLQVGVVAEF